MLYDLYFHNDLDGHASAAMFLSFLRSRGDDAAHFIPLEFDVLSAWTSERFFDSHHFFKGPRYPAVVLDFPYHPKAAFWFDHHPTTFKKPSWEKKFKQDRAHRLTPSAPSCAGLVYASLKKDFGWHPAPHFRELVRWLDVIDAARYRSVSQVIAMKEPALALDAYVDETSPGAKASAALVALIAEKPLAVVVRTPYIAKTIRKIRSDIRAGIAFYRKNLRIVGNATVIYLTRRSNKTLRFVPNYLYPDVLYNFRIYPAEGYYRLGVGANPWRAEKNKIHIGQLLKKRYDGGGHKNVGGAEFPTKRHAERAMEEMLWLLQRP